MASSTLQEQLAFIQQKQQMRFKEQRSTPKAIEQCHDLELKTVTEAAKLTASSNDENNDSSIVGDVDLPQVQTLQLNISQLKTKLKQAESKLVHLNEQRDEERRAMGGANSTITQRIVDLSKKNRELSAEVASERNKVRELQSKLKKSEAEIAKRSEIQSQNTSQSESEELRTILNQLKEQLQAANEKRVEYRNQCQTLKQDLKIARKVISKEVGDDVVNVAALLKTGSGWRGRSQQIIALQNKTTELQQRLNDDTERWPQVRKRSGTPIKGNADHRQVSALRKIEDTKKQNLELAQSELALLTIEHSKLQHQFSALRSRNKILTAELKSMKSKSIEPTLTLQLPSRPPSSETKQDQDKLTILEQRNRRLQTQLTKCLSELQEARQSLPVIRQQKSAPLPPLTVSRGCTRARHNKMASVGQLYSNVERETLSRVNETEKERLYELSLSLQHRLDLCNDRVVSAETELASLRQKYSGRDKSKSTPSTGDLEVIKNENEVLKETLEVTRQEKLADIQRLQVLLRDTKCMFVDSIKQLCVEKTST